MIFITTAMYCEASPLISSLRLKKDMVSKRFQVFSNDNITLIITGTGKVDSAIGTTYLLSQYKARSTDIYINIGICGKAQSSDGFKIGDIIMCNKLIDYDSNKSFYPDIIFKHPFKEGILETFSTVINKQMKLNFKGEIIDMEGTGAYKAAEKFLLQHKIYILKIVSDNLEHDSINSESVSMIIEKNINAIDNWIDYMGNINLEQKSILSQEEEQLKNMICSNLNLTTTMKYELSKLCRYYKIRGNNLFQFLKIISEVRFRSKNEGKLYFAKIRKKLIES